MGAMSFANQMGDTTIVWEEDNDDAMLAIIEKKMAEGVSFFILEPRLGGLQTPKKTKLANVEDARRHRALAIPDEDLAAFVSTGQGEAIPTPATKARSTRRAKTAQEAVKNETIAVKPVRGG